MITTQERVRVVDTTVLSDNWYVLRKVTFDYLRRDGTWQRQSRETYDRGNGATILLHNPATGNVVLTRQFRMPAFVNGHDGMLIEAAAGLLDQASPEARIRAEVEEETGYRVRNLRKVFEAFMSPGSVTEKLYFYLGEYDATTRIGEGGGIAEEGEDLEVVEMPLGEALAAIGRGEIVDGKTIMLLQQLALSQLSQGRTP
ncbi:ADP-ribose pyrophosphatase [Paraburkholderia bannensis]|uniref:GDP-mannose pyrophosphatase n=1 Tax=Paraburkholderia bannensis TaxID=765414 RepID=A0A7W9TVN4_9BURK|nr:MULTISPECIES: NUDIX domain-containing protein [Paraburkholderia]MBB3257341.1 ADP-ribose pyrophosphatase [Paraburkholderia sp. WP4_3_2]MBB6102263.1 ADP-ribose pyrophosphatase [Paraburkholderia bannensis]